MATTARLGCFEATKLLMCNGEPVRPVSIISFQKLKEAGYFKKATGLRIPAAKSFPQIRTIVGSESKSLPGFRRVRASVVNTETATDTKMQEKELITEGKTKLSEPEHDMLKKPERDFAGTAYIPIYVMLPLGVITELNEVKDPEELSKHLKMLKSVDVDGVMVDCWWGLVESQNPQSYNWSGYKQLFSIVKEAQLKLQVVMSFHQCGGNVGDDMNIPLPKWIIDIGDQNPDIFFTDREGKRNQECLSWGVDKERVFKGRTGLDCYDKYLQKSLIKAAEARGHKVWGKAPHNAGLYNSRPQDTDFFRDGGDWDSYYGRFFLGWYAKVLIDHGDKVLSLANLAFEDTPIAAKISGIHWWYKTASHAAELAAGFNNSTHKDGYVGIAQMFKKHNATFNFTCVELRTVDQAKDFPEALADPEGLVWQVLNAAWDAGIEVASENALPCYDRDGYNKILENAKPRKDPDGHHLAAFTYLRLNPTLMEDANFQEFSRFVKRLHGQAVHDLQK